MYSGMHGGETLMPYLPVLLSRAALHRAHLAEVMVERDFINRRIYELITHIAEIDRSISGLRALQIVRRATEKGSGAGGAEY